MGANSSDLGVVELSLGSAVAWRQGPGTTMMLRMW